MKVQKIWSKELLDNGSFKTQEEWITWCENNCWRLPTISELVQHFSLDQFSNEFINIIYDKFLMTSENLVVVKRSIDNQTHEITCPLLANVGNDDFLIKMDPSAGFKMNGLTKVPAMEWSENKILHYDFLVPSSLGKSDCRRFVALGVKGVITTDQLDDKIIINEEVQNDYF